MKNTTKAIKALQHANAIPEQAQDDAAHLGFHPAFLDFSTMAIYPSRYADGRLAPIHLLDGLPNEVVVIRSSCGRVIATKATLIAGYERHGFFYTRTNVLRATEEWQPLSQS